MTSVTEPDGAGAGGAGAGGAGGPLAPSLLKIGIHCLFRDDFVDFGSLRTVSATLWSLSPFTSPLRGAHHPASDSHPVRGAHHPASDSHPVRGAHHPASHSHPVRGAHHPASDSHPVRGAHHPASDSHPVRGAHHPASHSHPVRGAHHPASHSHPVRGAHHPASDSHPDCEQVSGELNRDWPGRVSRDQHGCRTDVITTRGRTQCVPGSSDDLSTSANVYMESIDPRYPRPALTSCEYRGITPSLRYLSQEEGLTLSFPATPDEGPVGRTARTTVSASRAEAVLPAVGRSPDEGPVVRTARTTVSASRAEAVSSAAGRSPDEGPVVRTARTTVSASRAEAVLPAAGRSADEGPMGRTARTTVSASRAEAVSSAAGRSQVKEIRCLPTPDTPAWPGVLSEPRSTEHLYYHSNPPCGEIWRNDKHHLPHGGEDREDTFGQCDSCTDDTYREDRHCQEDRYVREDRYCQEDTYCQDTYVRNNTCRKDPCREDPCREDPCREDPCREDPCREDPRREDPCREDPRKEDPCREDMTSRHDIYREDTRGTNHRNHWLKNPWTRNQHPLDVMVDGDSVQAPGDTAPPTVGPQSTDFQHAEPALVHRSPAGHVTVIHMDRSVLQLGDRNHSTVSNGLLPGQLGDRNHSTVSNGLLPGQLGDRNQNAISNGLLPGDPYPPFPRQGSPHLSEEDAPSALGNSESDLKPNWPYHRSASTGGDDTYNTPTNMFVDVNDEMFVGRREEMLQLERELHRKKFAGVSGMGGAGKTTFVCHYAYTHWSQYDQGVFFVDASKLSTLSINFAELAGRDVLNLVPNFDDDIPTSVRQVCNWLKRHKNYLLVFDAADDTRILEELGKQRPNGVRYVPPRISLRGHVIVTSRCPVAAFDRVQIMRPLLLRDLSLRDTCAFLQRRVYLDQEWDPGEEDVLQLIVKDHMTGRLPLFVEQTATYIRGRNLTFRKYLKELGQRRERLPVDKPSFGDNRKCVDDAFIHSCVSVQSESTKASIVLNMAALCHSRNIPLALFTFGALVLSEDGSCHDDTTGDLIEYILDNLDECDLDQGHLFDSVTQGAADAVRDLLYIPWKYQLLDCARGGSTFTVHEVLQEQLRLRMQEEGQLFRTLYTFGTMILRLLTSDNVLPARKRQFLAHAESCVAHMQTFGFEPGAEAACLDLVLCLQIEIASVFASVGAFPAAWRLVEELDVRIPTTNYNHLRAELVSLKARMCVCEHRLREALRHGGEALKMLDEIVRTGQSVTDSMRFHYAQVHKSCAHALIMLFSCEGPEARNHLSKAKMMFDLIMETSERKCKEDHAHLLMLYGLFHWNLGSKQQKGSVVHGRELTSALNWFTEAGSRMDPGDYMVDLCRVHEVVADVELRGHSSPADVEKLSQSLAGVESKLGRVHSHTAWVLLETATILQTDGKHQEAFHQLEKCLRVLEEVNDSGQGAIHMGQALLCKGKLLLNMNRVKDAMETLKRAKILLAETPENPTFSETQDLVEMVKIRLKDGRQGS